MGAVSDSDRISASGISIVAEGYVYILASGRDGELYTGATVELFPRILEHGSSSSGYAKNRGILRLVYYEKHDSIEEAVAREKRVKKWKRAWKVALIEKDNPEWVEIWPDY